MDGTGEERTDEFVSKRNDWTNEGLGPGDRGRTRPAECAGADRGTRAQVPPSSRLSFRFLHLRPAPLSWRCACALDWASRLVSWKGLVTLPADAALAPTGARRRVAGEPRWVQKLVRTRAWGGGGAHGGAAFSPCAHPWPLGSPGTPHPQSSAPHPVTFALVTLLPGTPSRTGRALPSVLTPPGAPFRSVGVGRKGASPPPLPGGLPQDPARTANTFAQFKGLKSVPEADKDPSFLRETWFSFA